MDETFRDARALAISHIGISQKSSGRVRDYLSRKGIQEETADSVVRSLISDGYIDDLRIARNLIKSRSGRKAEGRRALEQRLYHAGISREVIAMTDEIMPQDEISIQELFDAKLMPELIKLISMESFDANVWMNKTFRFLLSRGYSTSLTMDTLRKGIRDVE